MPILLLMSQPGVVVGPAAFAAFKFFIGAHLVEAATVQLPLCLWAGTPIEESVRRPFVEERRTTADDEPQIKWIIQTALLGFPSWLKFLIIANKAKSARSA